MNEQTVAEAYTVDETILIDSSTPPARISPALHKALQIGCVCNNAFANEEGVYLGQATDVALLNVLSVCGLLDQRQVKRSPTNVLSKCLYLSRVSHVRVNVHSTPRTSLWQ